jgi:hypothetical protein
MTTHPQQAKLTAAVVAAGERLQDVLRVSWEETDIQRTLQAARVRYGHALCTCRREPLKLQISLRDAKYHLAVWPREGASHDSECSFLPRCGRRPGLSCGQPPQRGDRTVPGSTPTSRDRVFLALSGSVAPASPRAKVVSVRALAHRLREAASLCRWHASWIRDWGRTRYQILHAASEFAINDRNAEDVLFMPRAFRKSQ